MIDRPFTAERCSQVEKESKDRLELLQKIKPQADIPESEKHLAYWKGLETFIQSFWKNETLLQQSVLFLKNGDKNAAIEILKVNPKETVELYANYASQLGILQGDRGLLTLMNLKWLPAFTGLQQQLGLEEYRINFAPTQHEPLAQGPGHRTFFITSDKQPYPVLGKTESGGEEWVLPDNAELIMKNVKENEKEIYRSGIVWKESVKILVVPAMASKFAPKNVSIPAGKRVLRIFSADPSLKQGESKEVLLSLYENKKDSRQVLVLGKCKTEYNTAAEFKFDIPAGLPTDLVLSAEPQQGSVSLCGLVME
ncbi:hypothetical protein FACS189427_13690 [Planctomycetales bacterium]|nr:hypothetical protein FACS189427_13690 [Planctomycetales bacterium]